MLDALQSICKWSIESKKYWMNQARIWQKGEEESGVLASFHAFPVAYREAKSTSTYWHTDQIVINKNSMPSYYLVDLMKVKTQQGK